MEVWSTEWGLYEARDNKLSGYDTGIRSWPHLGNWWDGDVLKELFNDGKIEKWPWKNPPRSNKVPRITQISQVGGVTNGGNPNVFGDIPGDWREEIVVTNADMDELLIFSTGQPSDIRLYTLARNPDYRNDLTIKGYTQSHQVDYSLGQDMGAATPAKHSLHMPDGW